MPGHARTEQLSRDKRRDPYKGPWGFFRVGSRVSGLGFRGLGVYGFRG